MGDKLHVLYKVKIVDLITGQRLETTKAMCSGAETAEGLLARNARKMPYAHVKENYCTSCAARVS